MVLSAIPHPLRILAEARRSTLLVVGFFGLCWGISAMSFGVGVAAVGMSLGVAIIAGLAAFAGTVIPFIVL